MSAVHRTPSSQSRSCAQAARAERCVATSDLSCPHAVNARSKIKVLGWAAKARLGASIIVTSFVGSGRREAATNLDHTTTAPKYCIWAYATMEAHKPRKAPVFRARRRVARLRARPARVNRRPNRPITSRNVERHPSRPTRPPNRRYRGRGEAKTNHSRLDPKTSAARASRRARLDGARFGGLRSAMCRARRSRQTHRFRSCCE